MKKTSDRRAFIRNVGLGTLGATALPFQIAKGAEISDPSTLAESSETPRVKKQSRPYNSPYTGEHLTQLAFPIGGLGAGMFCLEGTGAISHMSVKNKPDIFNVPNIFAAISIKGLSNGAKVLEGPPPNWKKFGQRDAGNGATGSTTGLPRFRQASCNIRFPFSHIDLADQDMPLKVRLTGWSPFIPTDENNSSLPLGALEYSFKNTGEQNIEAIFSLNSPNFVRVNQGNNLIRSLPNGFILTEEGTKADPLRTDFAFFTEEANTLVDHCWFRGGWWDPLTMAWNTVKNAEAKSVPPVEKNAPGASLYVPFSLAKGQEKTIKVFVAWYTPDTKQAIGTMGIRKENCDPESGCCNSPGDIGLDKYDQDYAGEFFKPWYSSQFKNIEDLAAFWKKQYPELRKNTLLFSDAFYKSTLPPEVIEAVAANLSILKSPTMMRQYDGRLWNFEGCGDSGGCCHGSCTHVWNYAQATAHLFPALERSLRNTEFCESQDDKGHQNFRSRLPITPSTHEFHAAADGQLGGILKVYREWRISGDDTWMRKIYPMVKKSLDYCISTWDPAEKGVTEEPHHNTYDIEFWGADGMHSSFYLGALNALIAMGTYLKKDVSRYQKILDKGKIEMEDRLYDGEYFIQDIQFKGLKAEDPTKTQSFGGEYSKEAKDLLDKEGPKYQYGKGCLSDGVLGSWIAVMCGLNDVVDPGKIKSHLKAVHKYNLKQDLSEHANPQRPSFAFGDDGGLLLCSWPKGGKLSLPFVYSDEVWTGIEHQVASHLMLMGQVKEGLEILQVSRNRYDGRIRNPFNEYECGHWYGRALSSYGYLQALTGVRYDAVEKTLYVDSKIGDFTSFICTETGFGTVGLKAGKVSVQVAYGKIEVQKTQIKGKSS